MTTELSAILKDLTAYYDAHKATMADAAVDALASSIDELSSAIGYQDAWEDRHSGFSDQYASERFDMRDVFTVPSYRGIV